jgi:methylated-DNA-[protein]-cysteine S-methyltransferase
MRWIEMDSPFGVLGLFASDTGLVRVAWGKKESAVFKKNALPANFLAPGQAERHLIHARDWLSNYFQGKNPKKLPPLDLSGQGKFSASVLKELAKVPWGTATTYGELARSIGNPGASRAVGQAVHRNPLCPFIACHRVLAAGGKLGGFAGGPAAKRKLLKIEGYPAPRF